MYPVDVHLDGGDVGMAKAAKYKVVHAGMTETVTVDQTSATGWVNIGEFEFAGTGDEYIELGDNTGEDTQLLFDAIRVLSPDAPMTMDDASGGCCDTSGRGGTTGAFAVQIVGLVLRRRRRPAARA
jgi:hypothetical protein